MIREELFTLINAIGDRRPMHWSGYQELADKLHEIVNREAEADAGVFNLPNITATIRAAKRSTGSAKPKREPVVVTREQIDDVYGVLEDTAEPLTFGDIYADCVQLTKPQLSKCIRRLISAGRIVDTGKGRGKRYHVPRRDSTPAIAAEVEIRPSTVPPGAAAEG
jgi:hypothetical protein